MAHWDRLRIVTTPTKLLRAMRKDAHSHPECGSRGNMLGVRVGVDIVPNEHGEVGAGLGGLSITPNDVKLMPPHVRPRSAGGLGNLPVFEIELTSIAGKLSYRADPKHPLSHGFVEPAHAMPVVDYQTALCTTATSWKELR